MINFRFLNLRAWQKSFVSGLVSLMLTVGFLVGSGALHAREASVDFDLFPKNYPIVLAFDLQRDEFPQAALIVNSIPNPSTPDKNISLPFKISDVKYNEKAKFRVGPYENWTLVSFSTRDANIWPQGISFVPIIERSFDPYSPTDTGLKSIALVSEGQNRKFRYRYPNASSSRSLDSVPADLKQHPDAIALALPKDSQEMAVRRGTLTVPSPLAALVFPAVSPSAGEQFLEVNYQVPPTDFQRSVVKWGVKLIAALLPIAGLFVLREDQIRNRQLRWSLIIGGTTVFVAVFGLIIWAAYSSNSREDVIGELVLCLGSAAISAAMFFSKTDSKPAAPAAPAG